MKIGKIDFHLHPIAVHFTNALFPVALFFLVLYLLSHQDSFRQSYFYILALAALSAPVSYLAGVVDWKQRYKGAKTSTFVKKIRYGVVLIIVGGICIAWYYFYPRILDGHGVATIVFLALNLSTLPLTVALGHLGGKLVFGVQR
ncbi:MAG: hypothetical protein A2Y65_05285 [Deltaproteobacteria bacterium RBG_13_52_11]|nr:MAG: hypothetical protein A2Y65_05285 [Deltaproteobacteria bacterium RBG_13_52_11]